MRLAMKLGVFDIKNDKTFAIHRMYRYNLSSWPGSSVGRAED
jgi:hypothetical protein